MKRVLTILAGVSVALALVHAQEGPQPVETAQGAARLAVEQSDVYGQYLVDGEGRTLYTIVDDGSPPDDVAPGPQGEAIKAEVVPCTGECLQAWPPLLTEGEVILLDEALDPALTATYAREDGSIQAIYGGYTLFYFARDEQPGEINGQGITSFGGTWYLVSPGGEEITQTPPMGEQQPATPQAAAQELRATLEQGIAEAPTPGVVEDFAALRQSLAGDDPTLEVVALAIADVEEALAAEAFDQAALVQALQQLALTMRVAADPGDEALTVELASLIDQTADFIQNEGYVPRMEVEAP